MANCPTEDSTEILAGSNEEIASPPTFRTTQSGVGSKRRITARAEQRILAAIKVDSNGKELETSEK